MNAIMHTHLLIGWLPVCLLSITAIGLIVVLAIRPGCSRRYADRHGAAQHDSPRQLRQPDNGIKQKGSFGEQSDGTRGRRGKRGNHKVGRCQEFLAALISGVFGYVLVWLISDVWIVFGVNLELLAMVAVAIAFALLALLIVVIIDSRGIRRIFAAVTIPLVIVSSALLIDMSYGEYTTIGSLFNAPNYQPLNRHTVHQALGTTSVEQWRLMADEGRAPISPKHGEVRRVVIAPTASGFAARETDVYLPPAALSNRPPRLPVMIMLAGQPGSPDRFFEASRITDMLDRYAAAHDGLAPIVVSPDQNGSAAHNSLCADTPVYGKAETYLTIDVTNWVKKHLPVSYSPSQWMIGGFSQGGTCSTQLGPAHPDLYGHIFAADGELEPTDQSRENTINRYFAGDTKAYERHVPTYIIAKHAPSNQTLFSAAGSWDLDSQRNQEAIGHAALQAGMQVIAVVVHNAGHDWHTVQAALDPALERFCKQTGLGDSVTPLSSYTDLSTVDLHGVDSRGIDSHSAHSHGAKRRHIKKHRARTHYANARNDERTRS
jgi:S-formylglutathione hydrolase FrmB